ncbi:MAG: isochorismatase family protein [Amylibacter sp.]|nr:isochorismatase family protein [Amylibacter sp.]
MKTALLVIDVQKAFSYRDATGGVRSCPQAEQNIGALLTAFRAQGGHVIHIHHHSTETDSAFRADHPGCAPQAFAAPIEGEAVVTKHVNSAFIGTTLETDLHAAEITRLVICGATANHCVETTTRMAGNLGFEVLYASDAVWAYEATGPDGVVHSAEQVHSMSLCNLDGEFAKVVKTQAIIERV